LAERAVQTMKTSLRKQGEGSLQDRVSRFLLSYRVTPHATTGVPPCELLMGRKLRTLLDKVRPNVADRVRRQQGIQKQRHDLRSKPREFSDGEAVLARDFANGGEWRQASVVNRKGAVSYGCRFQGDERIIRRHADQLRTLGRELSDDEKPECLESCEPQPERAMGPTEMQQRDFEQRIKQPIVETAGKRQCEDQSSEAVPELRRSQRKRTVPDRFGF